MWCKGKNPLSFVAQMDENSILDLYFFALTVCIFLLMFTAKQDRELINVI